MLAPSVCNADSIRSDGLADLTLAVREGRTRLTRSVTRPPLLVQRALYLDDALPDMAFVYLANPTAGVFQGDMLQVAVRACSGAKAHVTTQAATKIYAMPDGMARLQTRLHVEPGAYLEYLPDPVIPFRGARFSQETIMTVAPGGVLVYGDILLPGRMAMGEEFAYARFSGSLTVQNPAGRPLYREAFVLEPGRRSPRGRGLLGITGACVLGTLLVVTDAVDVPALRDCLRTAVGEQRDSLTGVSALPTGSGVVVKALGRDVAFVRAALQTAWAFARRGMLGVGLPARRKY